MAGLNRCGGLTEAVGNAGYRLDTDTRGNLVINVRGV